ncbi:hypothetical protein H0H92_003521 [Tricholoma furcatifolium]|nr:hypothetical protein H0H92_003521 [Tricholoma furcatifolium]
MSTSTSTSEKRKLSYPEYFDQSGSLDQWVCTLCTPSNGKGKKYMTLKAAQHHELRNSQHAKNIREAERRKWEYSGPTDLEKWDAPLRDGSWLTKDEMKMRDSQMHVDLVRDMVPFWIRGIEAAERGKVLRLEEFLENLEETSSDWSGGYEFVEAVARQEAVDEDRRQRMHEFFESFSPLPQVTTRTTSLASVSHASFALRFSDLAEIEAACLEDQEQRAARTIDWIGARINRRCAKWTDDLEKSTDNESHRTPWWDELRRCIEGDHVPSKSEGWNHPVAIIFAVSSTAPNPLNAVAELHARALEFPPWVDPNILRYTLIIHPDNSPLSDEEAGALFNAVKKQYGLHSYLLSLTLPTSPPPPVPVPAILPRLPPPPSDILNLTPAPQTPLTPAFPTDATGIHTIRMSEKDIQQTARFTREFLVMSLLPWMEKCVVDWNEIYSSTRRLPSRLFSSTRRLFGSASSSPTPTHNMSSSVSSLPSKTAINVSTQGAISPSPPPQQQRLAEFATILGDLKLAVAVWEALRKDGKGGSDMLPILLAPSPTLPLHAANALSGMQLQDSDPRPQEQLIALKYAVRWEAGIGTSDFLSYPLEGERWLVWAAGNVCLGFVLLTHNAESSIKSEEPPSALLLAHAALLSSRKKANRRASLWYLSAANRLEKCGIVRAYELNDVDTIQADMRPQKPLTMFFLRRTHELYNNRPVKSLSPSFWESEGQSPLQVYGIDGIMSGIEHPLGRLLYTTGDVAGAVRYFLGLLRGSSGKAPPSLSWSNLEGNKLPGADKLYLDDFRVAYAHFKATSPESKQLADLKLPFTFCLPQQTHLRLTGDVQGGTSSVWETRENQWKAFSKSLGYKDGLLAKHFWVDLALRNPLDTEVNLSNLTVIVEESNATELSTTSFVEVEVVDDVTLGAKESRIVSISIHVSRAASLVVSRVNYDFLSLLPSTESLASRGRRLHDTVAQRQKPTYAPDINIKINVEDIDPKLLVDVVDEEHLILAQGERKELKLWLTNMGSKPIKEIWFVVGPEDELWIRQTEEADNSDAAFAEVIHSCNSLVAGSPFRVAVELNAGENIEYPFELHAGSAGSQELNILIVYREDETAQFRSTRVTRSYRVQKIFAASTSARPHQSLDYMFLVQLELSSLISSDVNITQITCMSPTWKCFSLIQDPLELLPSFQSAQLLLGANPWDARTSAHKSLEFVSRKLQDVLSGRKVEAENPPPTDVLCTHITKNPNSVRQTNMLDLIFQSKRTAVTRSLAQSHPHIPQQSYPHVFPLYNPEALDFIVFWEIPSQQRLGFFTVAGFTLGAGHAALGSIIEETENAKIKRSMYAETQREKEEILEAVRTSEWNTEMNPVVMLLQEPLTVYHDFTTGPCRASIAMTIRNYSLTHKARIVLRLDTDTVDQPSTVS